MQGWLRPKEAANYSDVGKRTIWAWFDKGLRHAKIGGVTLIKIEWLDEFLEAREVSREDGNKIDEIVDEVWKELKN